MTYALFIVIAALLVDRWVIQRQHNKFTTEQEHAFRLERTGLLNRIQIPEAAPYIDAGTEESQHIPFEDDEAFNEAQRVLAEVDYHEEEV